MTEGIKKNIIELAFKKRLYPVFILSLLLMHSVNLVALNRLIEFENVELFRGQGSLTVFSISQDSTGFIWVASNKGLFRYDGINIKRYTYRNDASGCIFSNIIFRTSVDPQGTLWFSGNKAFGFYNPVTDSFKSFFMDSLLTSNFRSIYDLAVDSNSVCLGLMDGTLFRFDKNDSSLSKISNPNLPNDTLNKIHKVSIAENNTGFYFSYNSDIFKIDKEHYSVSKPDLNFGRSSDRVFYPLYSDKHHNLLVGTNNLEIIKFKGNRLNNIYTLTPPPGNRGRKCFIMDIQEESNGNLWLATSEYGLIYYNISTNHCTFSTDPESNIRGIDRKNINTVYVDNSGTIWVGTSQRGLFKSRSSYAFSNIESIVTKTDTLSNDYIYFMDILDSGNILCFIKNEGFVIFNPNNETLTLLPDNNSITEYLKADKISAMVVTNNNVVWLGTRQGLVKLDINNNVISRYLPDKNSTDVKYSNYISAVTHTDNNLLWVGTYTGYLYRFDINTSSFSTGYLPVYELPFKRIPGYTKYEEAITCIQKEGSNTLWLGTSNSGLALFDIQSGKTIKTYLLGNHLEKIIFPINYIKKDTKGEVWVTVRAHGFFRYDQQKDRFINYNDRVGLISHNITSIIEDSLNQIWLGTPVGIVLFDRFTNTFTPFDLSSNFKCYDENLNDLHLDNLRRKTKIYSQNRILSKLSGLALNSHTVVFGGPNGLTYFNPNTLINKSSPLMLADFKIFGDSQIFPVPVDQVREIKLSHKDYIFSFEYRIVDYNNPKGNKYAFWLDGFEKDWNYTLNDNKITYFNLPPGRYTMKAKGCNSVGFWNEQPLEITLTITPPYWQTWWFRISIGLALAGLVGLVFRLRISSIQKQKKLLEIQVRERTAELHKSNKKLKEEIRFRKKAEQELRKSEEEYRDLFENAYDVIWICDMSGKIQATNRFFQNLLGYLKDELIGTYLLDYISREHRFRAIRNYLKFQRDRLIECELNFKTRDNGIRILWLKVRGIYEDGGIVGIHGIGRDSTELKKAQAELREAERIKRESMKQLTLKLAHEIKNPLTSITSSAQLVASSKDARENQKIQRHMNIINKNVNICNQVIRELYTFTHKPKMNFRVIRISDLVKDLSRYAENKTEHNPKIKIVAQNGDSRAAISGDKFRLEQAFTNLINNAVDAMAGEGTLIINAHSVNNTVHIEISDTGCGMSSETLQNLYKPFFTSKTSGFGLGMPVVKEIIDAHQGTIHVESIPDQGTTFKISFKAHYPDESNKR